MLVRDAVAADLPAIVRVYNAAIPGRMATADTEPVSVDGRHAWFAGHTESRPLWVALVDDAIIGWLSFQSFYGRPAYRATAEVSVYVARGPRRPGVGYRLLSGSVETGPATDLRTVVGV